MRFLFNIILSLIFIGCGFGEDNVLETQTIYYETDKYKIKEEYLEDTIEVPGTIFHKEKAAISSIVSNARISKIYKDMGENIQKNQILAELDKEKIRLELLKSKNNLRSAQAQYHLTLSKYENAKKGIRKRLVDLEIEKASLLSLETDFENAKILKNRKEELLKIGGISESEYQNSITQFIASKTKYFNALKEQEKNSLDFSNEALIEAGYKNIDSKEIWADYVVDYNTKIPLAELKVAEVALKNARSQVRLAELYLREADIRSPIDGTIAQRGYDIGELIKQDSPIFTVINTDTVYVVSSVNEEKLSLIRKGQVGEFMVDAVNEEIFRGKVSVISPVIDPKSRMAEVKIKVDNKEGLLKSGMFVRLKIILASEENILALPASGFIVSENTQVDQNFQNGFCFVVLDGKVFKKPVIVGRKYNDKYVIVKGLELGDVVATSNIEILQDGSSIYEDL